jgi:hypothetical protein
MENRTGMFTASRCGDLLAAGTGKTALNYIFEIAENLNGLKKEVSTKPMLHGIVNEVTAIEILTSIYGGEPNQTFYKVNDKLGATPDAILEGKWVADSKCQYSIFNYFEQCDKLAKKYYLQLQVQMMALNVDYGYLINYLTKPEEFGQDDWSEYPFPLEERFYIHEVPKDEETCDKILATCEEKYPLIGLADELLRNAKVMDEDEFFYMQFVSKKRYEKLKDINWVNWDGEVIINEKTAWICKL